MSDAAPAIDATPSLLEAARIVMRECGATALFVAADRVPDDFRLDASDGAAQLICIVPGDATPPAAPGRSHLAVPNVRLTRTGQVKIALLLAMSRKMVGPDDVVVLVTGSPASPSLDTLVVTRVSAELNLRTVTNLSATRLGADSTIRPAVLERVLDLAVELGTEGREGRPVGALFVVGDSDAVRRLSRPLILNPFHGYPEDERSILDQGLEETVKELSSLDGAFIVRGDGVIECAGAYVKTAAQQLYRLPQGLGARHHAAAAITAVTRAVAVTVSHSTGTVTVFRDGRIVTEIEKLRSTGRIAD